MFDKLISKHVQKAIDARFTEKEKVSPPSGYNSLEVMRGGLYHWIAIPFNDIAVWCKLRTPRLTELESESPVSLIEGNQEKKNIESVEELVAIRNMQEAHAKCVLVSPTFDEIYKMVTGEDAHFAEKKKELEEIKKISLEGLSANEKDVIIKMIYKAELSIAYVLPDDTMTFLSAWAVGTDVSEIKKVNDEKFLEAALLSRRYGGKATDYIKGVFTERDEPDMNKYAMIVEHRYNEEKRIEKEVGSLPAKRK